METIRRCAAVVIMYWKNSTFVGYYKSLLQIVVFYLATRLAQSGQ